MKCLTHQPHFAGRLAIALVAMACALFPARVHAQSQKARLNEQQRMFASPEEAVQTLRDSAKAKDRATVHEIFGPEGHELLTGDPVLDAANFDRFSVAVSQRCTPVAEGSDKFILEIGGESRPFPIPLVKRDGRWFFDTDAGREEIINRHIGKDELNAIGVCRSYVKAQGEYASRDRNGTGVLGYAQKFKSAPGKRDGLYWESIEEPSPFGALVAEAHAEGYGRDNQGKGRHQYHGYFFKILTRQGRASTGGSLNYIINGNMTGGFALVAYPANWGQSGIMTFIINQEGKLYQRNLGKKTARIGARMIEYNPDREWTLIQESGLIEK